MKTLRFLSLLILGLLMLGFLGRDGQAQKGKPKPPPPTTGDPAIAYSYPRAKQFDLMVMNADGSNPTAVVSQSLTDNTEANWSPDGTMLVFSRTERKTGATKLCIAKVGALNVFNCILEPRSYGRPAWSPIKLGVKPDDHYKIAFTKAVQKQDGTWEQELFLVNEDGSDVTRLTETLDLIEGDVAWSPTGDRLAVETYDPAYADANSDIQIYQVDCATGPCRAFPLRNLIKGTGSPLEGSNDVGFSDWAKTQDKLVVSAQTDDGSNYELWIVDVNDPSAPTRLTCTGWNEWWPSFTPDDSHIFFSRGQSGGFYLMSSKEDPTQCSNGDDQLQIATPGTNNIFWAPIWRRNP
jgi:Tol biopolymer transport system component